MKQVLILMIGLIVGISSAKADLYKPVVTLCQVSKENPTKLEGLRLTVVLGADHHRFVTFSNVDVPGYPSYDRVFDLISEGYGGNSTDLDIAVYGGLPSQTEKERLTITQDDTTGIAVLSGHATLRNGQNKTFDKLTLVPCKD